MMALGAIANAARSGARAGAVTSGNYTTTVAAAQAALDQAGVGQSAQFEVTVNGVTVTDDTTFRANATPGTPVAVSVRVPYSSVSWLPSGTGLFLSSQQALTQSAVLCKEG